MSKETEREEIKDETHELQDDEQSDVEEEEDDMEEDWKVWLSWDRYYGKCKCQYLLNALPTAAPPIGVVQAMLPSFE